MTKSRLISLGNFIKYFNNKNNVQLHFEKTEANTLLFYQGQYFIGINQRVKS